MAASLCAEAPCSGLPTPFQVLVRFQDATHTIDLPAEARRASLDEFSPRLLRIVAKRTGWPLPHLCVSSSASSLPFVQIRVKSDIRGGKGGFGTLLKGQSRKAGARLTTDFGACRDLQGRRLRHVNDEIKLRKWREMQRKQEKGEVTSKEVVESMYDTPSGLYNWHLMTPTWADISKKATYRIKRQFQKMDREEEKRREAKQEKAQVLQNSITHYAEKATKATESVQASVSDALRQGLASQLKRKRKRDTGPVEAKKSEDEEQPNSLVVLSGDVVVEEDKIGKNVVKPSVVQIQSKSDFGTVVLVLDNKIEEEMAVYYETKLVTAGIAQVGWASLLGERPFAPDSESGDGAGDDASSYAFDGSRCLKFHAGEEKSYGKQCRAGDIVGCRYDIATGSISYSINGESMGEAFRAPLGTQLFPALSCNMGEILEMHIRSEEFVYAPKGVTPIHDLLSDPTPMTEEGETKTKVEVESGSNGAAGKSDEDAIEVEPKVDVEVKTATIARKKPIKAEPLDLEKYSSAAELEALGMDRLKGASMALRIKCGGSLKERAERLWSVKGLERKDFPPRIRAKNFIVM